MISEERKQFIKDTVFYFAVPFWLIVIAFFVFVGLLGLVSRASAQTCPQPFTLRQETCPAGDSVCSTKASTLTYRELDRDIMNTIWLCNGPGAWTWPADSAGIFTSNGTGTIAINNLSGDIVSSGYATTVQANSVALGTDTTGGYAASVSEGGPATTATALAANGANCSVGNYPLGVDTSGAVESCTLDDDNPDNDSEVPNAITITGGTIGSNTITGANKTANLVDEPAQANLGDSPQFLGLADGSVSTPSTNIDPIATFQRWGAVTSGTTIPIQVYYNQLTPGTSNVYLRDGFLRLNSRVAGDSVGGSDRILVEPFGLVTGLGATPSASGGTLTTNTYYYYVSAIVDGEEILGSSHVSASVTGPTGSVSLAWTALSGAASYKVYRYIPSSPDTSPVWFAAATNSFTDTGAAGTAGVGRAVTGWGHWAQCWNYVESGRCAAQELNVFNMTSNANDERTNRVGVGLGLQIVSGGTADTTAGIDLTGESASRFKTGILFSEHGFRDTGIDFRLSDATVPAIRLANTQDIVSRNAAGTANIHVLEVDSSNFIRMGTATTTTDPTNQRLGIITTSPDERLEIEETANASTIGLVQNLSNGSSAIAIWRAESDGALVGMQAHGSGRVATRFGVTIANYGELLQTTGNGLLIGTSASTPMILGTASNALVTLTSAGQVKFSAPRVDVPVTSTIADNGSGTAATATLTPTTASLHYITCNDGNGCTVTMGESGIIDGQILTIAVTTTNAVTINDSAGVSELSAAWVGGQYDTLTLVYMSDRWVQTSRSDN